MLTYSFRLLDIYEVDFPPLGAHEPGWISYTSPSGSSTTFQISNRDREVNLFAPCGTMRVSRFYEFENGAICIIRGGIPLLIQPDLSVRLIDSNHEGFNQFLLSEDCSTLVCANYCELVSVSQLGREARFLLKDAYDVIIRACTKSNVNIELSDVPGGDRIKMELDLKI